MPRKLTAGKADWYENKLGLGFKKDREGRPMMDQKGVGIDDAGTHWNVQLHVTLFRNTWRYQFQPHHDLEVIVDRIFGRGSRGVHVTLETGENPEPHCYLGGPNFGRDEAEKKLLEDILDWYMARFRQTISALKSRYDVFEFPDSDDPLEKLIVDPADGYAQIARMASMRHKADVIYPAQADSALLWAGAALHPMQSLQNTHQRLVRDAARLGSNPDEAKEIEGEELGKLYYFRAATPKLLGQPKDAAPDIEDQLANLEKALAKLSRTLDDLKPADAALRLRSVLLGLVSLRSLFDERAAKFPVFEAIDQYLKDLDTQIAAAEGTADAAAFSKIRTRLEQAHQEVGRALMGLCCIQNFHIIEPFYLFRLLVKFQVQSDSKIPATLRTEVSSTATSLLHNSDSQKWLFTWLRDKLVELDAALKSACHEKLPASEDWPDGEPAVVFFLKGGRAAKYLVKLPEKGENDWDTNIVINPNLPAADWYKNFVRVHNVVLAFLEKAKREFLIESHVNASFLNKALFDKLGEFEKEQQAREETETGQALEALFSDEDAAVDEAADDALSSVDVVPEKESENCKAELIDIGIPRRDTVEAFEQWFNTCPKVIICDDKIPIPGHLYYIAEYVMMIRDAFLDKSVSLQKTPKRVVRLLEVLEMKEGLQERVDEEKEHIPAGTLKLSLPKLASLAVPVQRMLTILLKQFTEAYDLADDAGLAEVFDKLFSDNVGDMKGKAVYPPSLQQAITKEGGKYEAKHVALGDAIGYAQWVSQQVDEHLRKERASFMMAQRDVFINFVKAIYTASFFAADDDLEVQFAVTGPFAALLHAEYAKFERMEALEPVKRLDLTIYCQKGHDPATVRELILPLVKQYVSHPTTPNLDLKLRGDDAICLTWPKDLAFPAFTYKPMVIKLQVERREADWPQLAFLKGMPVLSLRDLVWEYKRHAGHIEETFTQRGLKTAIEALVDILTRFENPNPGAPFAVDVVPPAAVHGGGEDPPPPPPPSEKKKDAPLTPIEAGTARYLMVTGSGAVGIDADYPGTIPEEQRHKWIATNAGALRKCTDLQAGSQDRTLDLLVLTQGHGDVGSLFDIGAGDWKSAFVDPLVKAGVKARIIVLDACLTASLCTTFAPLLTDDGHMIVNLYTLNSVVVDSDLWTTIHAQLDGSHAAQVYAALEARMKTLSRANTGLAWETQLNELNDTEVGTLCGSSPGAADVVSAVKYLPELRNVISGFLGDDEAVGPVLGTLFEDLAPLAAKPQLHALDRAILAHRGEVKESFGLPQFTNLKTAFRARLTSLLKDATYKVQLAENLDILPLIGDDSLFHRFASNRRTLLGNAPGLTRCPTSFGVFSEEALSADRALAADTLAPAVKALLDLIDIDAATDVPNVIAAIDGEVIFFDDYLQS